MGHDVLCVGSTALVQPVGLPALMSSVKELRRTVGGFQLTGGKEASLKQVNGGSLCVGSQGVEPPGFELIGAFGLGTCAAIASAQPKVIGFRWGGDGFDLDQYRRYADPPKT